MEGLRLLINGRLVDGDDSIDVINPATGAVMAKAPRASKRQLDEAVAAAKGAFPAWRDTSLDVRRRVLNDIADILIANVDQLARTLTQEQGKPLPMAQGEIHGTAFGFRQVATRELADKILEDGESRKVELRRRPLGVVGAIIPWNFPMVLMGFKVPMALLCGNTVVLKPAATTPLTTLLFASLVKDVLPPGVLNVISDANDLGGELTRHPDVAKISFTGSSETGRKVMAGAADTLKRITLELGGNDAAIVLPDADPKEVSPSLFALALQNSGQVCIAIKRLYVHESIYDDVCANLAQLADAAVVGDGLEQGTQYGPLQNKMQYEKVLTLIEDTKAQGNIIAGGVAVDRPGYFIRPTVVRDITDGARLVDEEQFGPVIPVIKYSDPDDAVRRANASPYGLGASVWSKDEGRALSVASKLESGTVWINKHSDLAGHIPFSGAKTSGFGVELGDEGLHEFTQIQVINAAR